jgi:hypothetical protein
MATKNLHFETIQERKKAIESFINKALTGGEYKDLNGSIRGEFELGAAMFFSQKAGVYFSYNVEALNGHNYNHSLIKHMANKSFTLMGMYRF